MQVKSLTAGKTNKFETIMWKMALKQLPNVGLECERPAFEIPIPEVKPRSEITFSLLVRSCLQSHTEIGITFMVLRVVLRAHF